MAPGVEIREADEGLLAKAAALHAAHYGGTREEREERWRRRFGTAAGSGGNGSSFAVVAVEGGKVVGTQTYTDWPYEADGQRFAIVQSGLTLVDDAARGKGVFSRMLAVGDEGLRRRGVRAVVGYPTPMSHGGFSKAGWTDVGALRWYVRPIRWWRLVRRRDVGTQGLGSPVAAAHLADPRVGWDGSFERVAARGLLASPCDRAGFERHAADRSADFVFFRDDPGNSILVARRRPKHGFRELVVGEAIARKGSDPAGFPEAIRALARDAKRSGTVDAVTVLLNSAAHALRRAFIRAGFWRTGRTVPFIAKGIGAPLSTDGLDRAERWNLLFADIDTWSDPW